MIQRGSRVLVAGVAILAAASLGGCATKKFVREQAAVVGSRVDVVETHVNAVEGTAKDALARADAAGKLAEGKFLYTEVLSDDSMKFLPGKSTLTPEAQARLDTFIDKLKADNKNVFVEIQGHTDASGDKAANYRIGQQRADAVKRYLYDHGVALNRISTISYGADAPVAPNTDKAGREANRRVVLVVMS